MYKNILVTKEVMERHKFCGVCDIEIPIGLACSATRCQICQEDICENCIGTEKESAGEYRQVWCKNCWTIGEKYRPKIKELDAEIKKLYDAWYREC